ncbi:MAG: PAS domain-containing protein [Ferrovibrio sp.]
MPASISDPGPDLGPDPWPLPPGADGEAFARIHAYWRSKCRRDAGGRWRLPARTDIDPLEIPRDLLPGIVLLEIEDHDGRRRFRLRLFGSDVEAMTGGNETGRYYDEVTDQPGMYERIDAVLGQLIAERQPVYVAAPSGAADRGFLLFGRLALPLASDGWQVDMILGLVRPLPA